MKSWTWLTLKQYDVGTVPKYTICCVSIILVAYLHKGDVLIHFSSNQSVFRSFAFRDNLLHFENFRKVREVKKGILKIKKLLSFKNDNSSCRWK